MIRRILGAPLPIPTILMGVLALGAAGCAARPAADQVTDARNGLLISNVRVFDVAAGAFSEPTAILVRDGRIHAVGPSAQRARPEEEVDVRGAFALPGLWDSHVHLSALSLGGPDSVRAALDAFVQAGVLYVRDVGGPLDVMVAMRDRRAGR